MSEVTYAPSEGLTRLVMLDEPDSPVTSTRETDTLGAATRGLAEYLGQVYLDWLGTRLYAVQVFDQGHRSGEETVYPSVFVLPPEGDTMFGPAMVSPETEQLPAPDGRHVSAVSFVTFRLRVVIEATNQLQRQGMSTLVEGALVPFPTWTGFSLDLPHYHNARCRFTWVGYGRTESDPSRNEYRQVYLVDAQVPVVVVYAEDMIRVGEVIPYVTVELPPGAEQSVVLDNTDWPRRSTRRLGFPGRHVKGPPLDL